jgi:hypothetical protein
MTANAQQRDWADQLWQLLERAWGSLRLMLNLGPTTTVTIIGYICTQLLAFYRVAVDLIWGLHKAPIPRLLIGPVRGPPFNIRWGLWPLVMNDPLEGSILAIVLGISGILEVVGMVRQAQNAEAGILNNLARIIWCMGAGGRTIAMLFFNWEIFPPNI